MHRIRGNGYIRYRNTSEDREMTHTSSLREGSQSASASRAVRTRSRLEEEMFVLGAVSDGANNMESLKTKTELPWPALNEVTASLLRGGFLTVDDGTETPKLSVRKKGLDIVERYRGILDRITTARAVMEIDSN